MIFRFRAWWAVRRYRRDLEKWYHVGYTTADQRPRTIREQRVSGSQRFAYLSGRRDAQNGIRYRRKSVGRAIDETIREYE